MKSSLLLSLLLLSCFTQAQSYLDHSTQWVETEEAEPLFEGMNKGRYFRLTQLTGDTVIDGTAYYQAVTHFDEYEVTVQGDTVDAFSYDNHWFLREQDGRFYKITPSNHDERLLFDFNLNVGDTAYINENYHGAWVVQDIAFMPVGGSMRKAFHLARENEPEGFFLIEGVGTSRGFFSGATPPCCNGEPLHESVLNCYANSNGVFVLQELPGYCEEEAVSAIQPAVKTGIRIFPNLIREEKSLAVEGLEPHFTYTYRLAGLGGKGISSGSIEGNRVGIGGLAAGVYYLSIIDGKGYMLHTEKVVKML
ncbi:MAG: hypothetical protein KDC66_20750 [Phaeodactylibacter sp.]|nr:hypothetical protein [Phaeodactylibacter sp.]